MTLHPRIPVLFSAFLATLIAASAAFGQPFFDYDNRADFGVFRPSEGAWYSNSSESGANSSKSWGLSTDRLVPGDYDGDGLTDLAVWRAETGVWYVLRSSDSQMQTVTWGTRLFIPNGWISDEPVPGDYDGDGHDDFAVWRPSTGEWFVLRSLFGFNPAYATVFKWGKLADIPVQADYDGDRRVDFAVFRSTENRWYAIGSSDGAWRTTVLGQAGADKLVPADYTGDGKADFAVFRNGNWIIEDISNGSRTTRQFGLASDTPVPADYDGDGRTDIAVYRGGQWFVFGSELQSASTFTYGSAGDVPLASLRARPSIVGIP